MKTEEEFRKFAAEYGRLKLTMFGDIDPLPNKEWTVERLLGAKELSVIAAPGAAKSCVAGDIAGHVAAGEPWAGRRVKQGAVLYIAAERAAVVKRRFAAFVNTMTLTRCRSASCPATSI